MTTPDPRDGAPVLSVTLDRADPRPLGTQLADQVRARITTAALAAGTRLPSSRALAAELGVARSVTEQAYAQLVAEGWLEGRHGSGTYVSAAPPQAATRPARRAAATPPPLVRLSTGTPWIDPRHRALWRRAWREVSATPPPPGYDDPRGLPELRVALAERLAHVRGVACDPDEVLLTAGTSDGLRHVLGALPPGAVAVEDPGYRAAAETVLATGRPLVDVPALTVADLTGTVAAYVTPAHQHPLGRTMPGADRLALLTAAREAGAVVIEDDYDSELRYDVAPVPALAGLDRERVVYLGTASKAVSPSLRLGWLVAPPAVRERIEHHRAITHDSPSWPAQRALLALLRDGYVDKVVRSARRVYAERAARVVEALSAYGEVTGPVAGMYATFVMPEEQARAAHAAGRAAGYDVPLLADQCRTHVQHGLVVGFGGSLDDRRLDHALGVLARALRG